MRWTTNPLHFVLGILLINCFNPLMSLNNLTPTQLRQAADLKEQIEELQSKLSHLQGDGAAAEAAPAVRNGRRGKRKISAAGRARIRAAQIARWAKVKGTHASAEKAPAKRRGPRKMSAAARAKIAAAARARWARFHAAQGAK